ncbi:hypothetical protein BH10CYA1_BH10CYA1_42030 [soil metagenome]
MKRVQALVLEHKHHIFAALFLSVGIFVALMLVTNTGIGGINQNMVLLFVGLFMAEAGRSLMHFGARLNHIWLEYFGVFVQGLAWWIWSLNLEFMRNLSGTHLVLNLTLPALIIGALPVVAHHGAKHLIALNNWDKSKFNKSE